MGACVLLRHDLPGHPHYDWLFERAPGGPLLAFRTNDRIDALPDTFAATRLPDHRHAYLTYEGPVSGGRGSVTRLATGTCRILADEPGVIRVELGFEGGTRIYTARPADSWIFTAHTDPAR